MCRDHAIEPATNQAGVAVARSGSGLRVRVRAPKGEALVCQSGLFQGGTCYNSGSASLTQRTRRWPQGGSRKGKGKENADGEQNILKCANSPPTVANPSTRQGCDARGVAPLTHQRAAPPEQVAGEPRQPPGARAAVPAADRALRLSAEAR